MSTKYRYLWLHGSLAVFGARHRLMVDRPREMINALVVQCPGFEAALRRGRFAVFAGPKSRWRAIDGVRMDEPIDAMQLHLVPELSGHGRGEGKMLLGLTLLGLSFVPGVQAGLTSGFSGIGESLAGASGAELGGMLGSRLLGGAGTWLMMAGASEALAPQLRQPAGDPSGIISGPQPAGEGAAVPLVYGRARVESPPIISAGVTVRTMVP